MKIGDRDTPGTRIYSEREFREQAQVLAATEAAGEGINLQFCWFMINFDIPWNPVRLEQRMGRIHRYGQEHDCLILNFVAINTNEGRVLTKLLERLREIRKELGTDQVFDVVGEIFPGNLLERLFRDLYVRKTNIPDIEARIVRDVNPERFRAITESTLEGLAKKELNLSAIVGKSVEARERRLVPEVVEDFFVQAGPVAGVQPKTVAKGVHVYRVGKLPRTLISIGQRLEGRFGRLGREYAKIAFDKALLTSDPTLEWVTPGHPLFEVVREDVLERVADHLRRGAVFFDLQRERPARLDTFAASIKDGQGHTLHRRLYVVEASNATATSIRQPTIFLDGLVPAPAGTGVPADDALPDKAGVEQFLLEHALQTFLIEATGERERQVETVSRHVEISLTALIDRQNQQLADLLNRQIDGQNGPRPRWFDLPGREPPRPAQRSPGATAPGAGNGTPLHHRRHHAPRPGLGAPSPRADHRKIGLNGSRRRDRADRRGIRYSARASTWLAGRERREGQPRLRLDLTPATFRRSQDGRRGPLY